MADARPTERGNPNDSTTEGQDLWEQSVEAVFRGAPSWLFSVVIHVGILIILALIFLPRDIASDILLNTSPLAEEEGDQLIYKAPEVGKKQDKEPLITPDNLEPVEDPLATPPTPKVDLSATTTPLSPDSINIGLALKGRTPGMKKMLLGKIGGSEITENSVLAGLRWLAKNQNKRYGFWNLTGPYQNGGHTENREAATAMALLAFQGAGYTHRLPSEFKDNVTKGINWLLAQQDQYGCFYHAESFNARFYTQAQATIVVCELYGMTYDPKLKKPAEKAIEYLVFSQSPKGGWRYKPQVDSDLSVTGWVVMALQSARMAGLQVPSTCLGQVNKFLDTVSAEMGSRYGYTSGSNPTPSMTAEGLLCRQYLGWKRNDRRLLRGVDWLTMPENLINYNTNWNVYYWYYATQVMHHMGGEPWERWNNVMKVELPDKQVRGGREAGSWNPNRRDIHDVAGGRLYVTCLSIYMLEVYYRHLPLYRHEL